MSVEHTDLADELARLRAEFDRGFTLPPRAAEAARSQFCLVEAGGETLALSTDGLRGMETAVRLVPVGSADPGVLGLAAIGGELMPVLSLAVLLGLPSAAAEIRAAALVAVAETDGQPVAFALDRLNRYASAAGTEIFAATGGDRTVRLDGVLYRVVEPRVLLRRLLEGGDGAAQDFAEPDLRKDRAG